MGQRVVRVEMVARGRGEPRAQILVGQQAGHGFAPGRLVVGDQKRALVVDDGNGGSDSASVDITVTDVTPPGIASLSATPATLWPPNHAMRRTSLAIVATDNCDAAVACSVAGVSSNEPENGLGDGDTSPDFEAIGDFATMLRAERAGTGSGRVYSVEMVCRDFTGNTSTARTTITVPKSQGY